MKRKKTPVPKEHPALMPKLAWQELIKEMMAEQGDKIQYIFANKIEVHAQTVSRWLSDAPSLPDPDSFIKVANFLKISETELAAKWASVMSQRYGAYAKAQNPASDIREPAAVYGELELLAQAKALESLDLKLAPIDQRPFIHQHRREILELAREIEEMKSRLSSRLRAMLASFRELYDSAVDTARRWSPQGPPGSGRAKRFLVICSS